MGNVRDLIAVVDDEEPVRIALRRLLRSAGFDVEMFASGAQFLQSLKGHRPDCVVLDLHMAQVNGFAVQERLAAAAERPPVVVITGHDSESTRERALAGGASAYLRKPVDDGALLDAIATAIARSPGSGERQTPVKTGDGR
jgi:FixJ family two-component response regulator